MFVLTLCSGLKAAVSMFDAPFDCLIVASFKMNAVEVMQCAPVPAVKRVIAFKVQASCDGLIAKASEQHHRVIREMFC